MASGNPLMPPGGSQGLVAAAGPAMTAGAGGQGGGGLGQLASPQNAVSGGPGGAQPPGMGPDGPAPVRQTKGPMADIMAAHDQAKSVFEQVNRSRGILDHMRREMDQLVTKGDTIAPEDVIAAAGRVIGHGAGARDMASILATMPQSGGQGLAAWLLAHDTMIRQQEAVADQALKVAAHRYGMAGLGVVAGVTLASNPMQRMISAGVLGPRPSGAGITTSPRPVTGEPGQAGQGNALMPQVQGQEGQ